MMFKNLVKFFFLSGLASSMIFSMEKSQPDPVAVVGLKTYQELSKNFDFFEPQTTNASSNSSFWSVKNIDNNKVTLEKQEGAKFSEALEDLLEKGGKIECSLARSIVMNKAIIDQLGDKNFDQFASLYEELSGKLINFSKFQGLADYFLKIPFKEVPYPINSIEGYVNYLSRLPAGMFLYMSNLQPYFRPNHGSGENLISLGNGKFMGFGKHFGENGLGAEDIFKFLKEEYFGCVVDEDEAYNAHFLAFQRGLHIYEIDPLMIKGCLDEEGSLNEEIACNLILSML